MALLGGQLQPATFSGAPTDEASQWLKSFNKYGKFASWDEAMKLDHVDLFLAGKAEDWCNTAGIIGCAPRGRQAYGQQPISVGLGHMGLCA